MENIHPVFDRIVGREEKEISLKQKGLVIWFTGLSGSGKTTLSVALEKKLFNEGKLTQILDGDNIRSGINNNLGFSNADRVENIRRISEIAKLFMNCGIVTLCAFVSPTVEIRQMAIEIIGRSNFFEVYVSTPLEECERRDVKGLYKKARNGEIKDFTGISAPFDTPIDPDVVIDTTNKVVEECVEQIYQQVISKIEAV